MAFILKNEKIVDSWGMVIENAVDRQEYLLDRVEEYLEEASVPKVTWQTVEATPGLLKGLLGTRREFLMVTHEVLKDWRIYVGVRDYGAHCLDVSWFLTVEPGIIKQALSGLFTRGESFNELSFTLDLFAQQELRAYVSVVHRLCVKKAVEQLLEEIGQETLTIDWRSKGFLKIW